MVENGALRVDQEGIALLSDAHRLDRDGEAISGQIPDAQDAAAKAPGAIVVGNGHGDDAVPGPVGDNARAYRPAQPPGTAEVLLAPQEAPQRGVVIGGYDGALRIGHGEVVVALEERRVLAQEVAGLGLLPGTHGLFRSELREEMDREFPVVGDLTRGELDKFGVAILGESLSQAGEGVAAYGYQCDQEHGNGDNRRDDQLGAQVTGARTPKPGEWAFHRIPRRLQGARAPECARGHHSSMPHRGTQRATGTSGRAL